MKFSCLRWMAKLQMLERVRIFIKKVCPDLNELYWPRMLYDSELWWYYEKT